MSALLQYLYEQYSTVRDYGCGCAVYFVFSTFLLFQILYSYSYGNRLRVPCCSIQGLYIAYCTRVRVLVRMDGWMDYTSLCIDHGPLAGGISATRGGGLPVSTYNPRGAFVSSDHSLLSDNPDMPLLQGRWRFICSRCPSCRGL